MNFRHSKNLITGVDGFNKIHSAAWSTNNMRLAIAQADKKISLFDENGEKKESFSTKPAKSSKNYIIREICFSPDSTRLAVAQSDCIIYVYKLGTSWADKKTICNKLEQPSPVTSMIWPKHRMNEIYFGLADGKVKVGTLKNNQSAVLYSTEAYVVSLSASPDGKFLLSGHLDNVIQKYNFENSNVQKMVIHSSVPYCLAWTNSTVLAAGNDYKVIFYSDIGSKLQSFDFSHDEKLKEFTVCRVSPNGDTIALGNYNKFHVFLYNARKQVWEEGCIKNIEGMYSVTALCWKPDGSGLVTGNICGSVDIFEACLKKSIFKEKFEITYVSHSQVVIKNLETAKRLVIKPNFSSEITKINIYLDNYIAMFTKESLVLGDLDSEKYSEIQWKQSTQEKFDFSNQNVCMVFNQGDLTLIEYGNHEIIGYCRTEYIHSNLISVRINYNSASLGLGKNQPLKVLAYLIDLNTIYIEDLQTKSFYPSLTHDSKIDFIELNKSGNKLIFRDRKRHLYLYNFFENKKITLLNYCGYVQWVPNSEVLVAQERKNLCVWYNVDDVDKVKIIPIKGEVEEIRRREGKTEVLVEEGANTQTYLLDDGLIAFSTAVDENNLNKAVKILENLELTAETETHWKTLAKLAISNKNLMVAQRCYAAIGYYSKTDYLKKVMKLVEKNNLAVDNPVVEARLLILDKQFNNAENLLLSNNLLDEAIEILNELQKWDESVKIAEKYNHPEIVGIKSQYFNWLISNDQLDKAAELKEREGDFITAINLYIQGGYPAKAANLVKMYDASKFDNSILENIIKCLKQVGINEKEGELLEIMGHYQRSIEAYREAKCFSKAVEIAKKYLPNRTERLEEEWGEFLFSQKQFEPAINHFLESGSAERAIEAAIQARKWEKAIELVNKYPNVGINFFIDIGRHFETQRRLDLAEKYYVLSRDYIHAFNMYVSAGKWEKAESIIKKYMKDEESSKIICNEALRNEQEGKYKEAEKLYILAGEHDVAISMYKSLKQYESMIRLVSLYRPDFLKNTHKMVASYLEADGNLKQAEKHYIESGNWKICVNMYKSHNFFEEALRVAKSNGSEAEINEISKNWVQNMPKQQQISFLLSMGQGKACIDILCDNKDFEEALKFAEQHEKYKIPDIHLRYAMHLEEERKFHDAEEHYIKANQIQEVIQMYEHIEDFQSSLRVARQHDPSSVVNIYFSQGVNLLKNKEYAKAEVCFVNAKQPEYMIKVYCSEKNLKAALKYASKYAPHMENDIRTQMLLGQDNNNTENLSVTDLEEKAKLYEDSKDYSRAIDTYLEISEKHVRDHDKLEELWNRAVNLALEFEKASAQEIVNDVAIKFKKIGRFNQAANLFENINNIEEAVKCYTESENYDRAYKLANLVKGEDQKKKLVKIVEERQRKEYITNDDPMSMISNLRDEEGLKMLFQKGEFQKCLECAESFGPKIFNEYLILVVKKFLGDKNLAGAVDFLEKHKTPIYKYNLDLYRELALEILAEENLDELRSLKEMLICVIQQLKDYPEFKEEFKILTRMHKIAYYQYIKFLIKTRKDNFVKTYYRVCLSVLAFGDIIKLDLALLDAANICKDIGLKSNAFILFNRYLDMYEVIEDPSLRLEEESELKDTEITQVDPFRSEANVINSSQKEEIHEWIVKTSVDKNVNKSLNRKACPKCAKPTFEANSLCMSCGYLFDCCVVSGFPIHQGVEKVSCTSCNKSAIKDCWREWIGNFEQCPWCKSVQMSH